MAKKQVPFRLHSNDHKAFKLKCEVDNIKMQTLVESAVMAYLDGDQHVKKLALEWKQLNTVNKKTIEWSARDQNNLLDEIEDAAEGGADE